MSNITYCYDLEDFAPDEAPSVGVWLKRKGWHWEWGVDGDEIVWARFADEQDHATGEIYYAYVRGGHLADYARHGVEIGLPHEPPGTICPICGQIRSGDSTPPLCRTCEIWFEELPPDVAQATADAAKAHWGEFHRDFLLSRLSWITSPDGDGREFAVDDDGVCWLRITDEYGAAYIRLYRLESLERAGVRWCPAEKEQPDALCYICGNPWDDVGANWVEFEEACWNCECWLERAPTPVADAARSAAATYWKGLGGL